MNVKRPGMPFPVNNLASAEIYTIKRGPKLSGASQAPANIVTATWCVAIGETNRSIRCSRENPRAQFLPRNRRLQSRNEDLVAIFIIYAFYHPAKISDGGAERPVGVYYLAGAKQDSKVNVKGILQELVK
ncbi:hypothetical protein MVEN_00852700 [Mycena venus]|uniref:Uncharacterized protein n=1 Tax=Mycena venus TaxID=2733690 RepID=A0A8H6YGX5_9AGAR|nr:hypothetical protein MVEN_00852700 [Mycena venus]